VKKMYVSLAPSQSRDLLTEGHQGLVIDCWAEQTFRNLLIVATSATSDELVEDMRGRWAVVYSTLLTLCEAEPRNHAQ
jgi:hypothetical protein